MLAKCSADYTRPLSLVVLAKYGPYHTVLSKCGAYTTCSACQMQRLPRALLTTYA